MPGQNKRTADAVDEDVIPTPSIPPTPPASHMGLPEDESDAELTSASLLDLFRPRTASAHVEGRCSESALSGRGSGSATRSGMKRPCGPDSSPPATQSSTSSTAVIATASAGAVEARAKRARHDADPIMSLSEKAKHLLIMLGSSLPADLRHPECEKTSCTLGSIGHVCWDNFNSPQDCCHVVRSPHRFKRGEATPEQVRSILASVPCSVTQAFHDAMLADRRAHPNDRRCRDGIISRRQTAALNQAVTFFCPPRPRREPHRQTLTSMNAVVIDLCDD